MNQARSKPREFRTKSHAHIMHMDGDLFVIATLQTFLFISFLIICLLATGKVAAAQDSVSCKGQNLISTISKDNLAKIQTALAKIPNGEGLFWKVEKDGVAPSYLYGTMHVSDPRVLDMPKRLETAVDAADIVVIETLDILDPTKAQGAILMNPELTMFTNGDSVTSGMSDADRFFFEQELERRGISLAMVSRMKPWVLFGMLGVTECEMARKMSGAAVLDVKIIKRAQNAGKDIDGLESMLEQVSVMASLPIEFQTKGLIESMRVGDMMDDVMETMTQLYLDEQVAMFKPLMAQIAKDMGGTDTNEADYGAFEQKVIIDRNILMSARSAPLIEKGNALIAVGALHLPGAHGMIELLRDKGYKITRLAY